MYHHYNRKILQLENGKILIILQNIETNKIEIRNIWPKKQSIMTLHPHNQCLFAVNEPKGLIGIYELQKGEVVFYTDYFDYFDFFFYSKIMELKN